MSGVVVGELSHGQPESPVVMVGADIGSKDLFNGAVSSLGLAISLRMVGGGHVESRAKTGEQSLPKLRGDAGVAVRDDEGGETFQTVDVVNVQMGELGGGNGLVGTDEEGLFSKQVDEGGDGVIGVTVRASRVREICDEVHRDVGPWTRGNGVREKEARSALS